MEPASEEEAEGRWEVSSDSMDISVERFRLYL
jgi:hypothetical protein